MRITDLSLFDRYPVLRKVIINLKSDKVFRGVLWRKRGRYLVLREAELLKPGGGSARVDGEVVIESSNVDFLQVLT